MKERDCNRRDQRLTLLLWTEFSLLCYGESVTSSASDNVIHTFKALCCWKQLKFARRTAVCIFCCYFSAVIMLLVHSGVWNTKHWFWALCYIHRCKNCYVKGCVTITLLENCLGLNISTGEWADSTNNFYFSHRNKNNQLVSYPCFSELYRLGWLAGPSFQALFLLSSSRFYISVTCFLSVYAVQMFKFEHYVQIL